MNLSIKYWWINVLTLLALTFSALGNIPVKAAPLNILPVFSNAVTVANNSDSGSLTISNSTVSGNSLAQRGVLRPQSAACDIGPSESVFQLTVTINQASTQSDPAQTSPINFTAVFSNDVAGFDGSDVTLAGTANPARAVVTGGPSTSNVAVSGMTGSGTVTAVIAACVANDAAGDQNTASTSTDNTVTYQTARAITFQSVGSQDGWVLESSETSNVGGALSSASTTFNLGDDAAKRQYRGILSFNTGAALPDNAVITGVTLKVKQQAIVGGGNPMSTFQGLMVDVKNGFFGTAALQASDFQAAASQSYGPFNQALVGGWYSINLTSAKAFVNKLGTNSGLTQLRLRFKLDDNNNAIANVLSLYSGDGVAANRPQLVITYSVP